MTAQDLKDIMRYTKIATCAIEKLISKSPDDIINLQRMIAQLETIAHMAQKEYTAQVHLHEWKD